MATNFGWKALVAVLVNAATVTALFWRQLTYLKAATNESANETPHIVTAMRRIER